MTPLARARIQTLPRSVAPPALMTALALSLPLAAACSPEEFILGRAASPVGGAGAAGSGAGGFGGAEGGSPAAAGPVLIASVDLTRGGPGTRILLGDVTGDGRPDIVTMQPDSDVDSRTPHQVACLTAFELDGTLIWQVGVVDPDTVGSASDTPAQIYDLDGDGNNEVLAVMEDRFRVLDGRTGQLKQERELPDPNAHDAIVIANLTGGARPEDIVLKDRYQRLWAFDRDWNQLFTYSGDLGYYPWPYDWDHDGRDELVAGCIYLDHDGTEQWNCNSATDTTVDAVWTADLDLDPTNGEEIVISGGDTFALDRTGQQRWLVDTVEAQNLAIADFRPEIPGLEVAGLDRVVRGADGSDAMFLLSAAGETLWREQRPAGSGWSTILNLVHDWDGTGRDLIMTYARGNVLPGLYDGESNVVASFPDADALLMHDDICGDQRQEVVAYTQSYAHVYASEGCTLSSSITGTARPQPKRLYNWTRYWGGEYPQ